MTARTVVRFATLDQVVANLDVEPYNDACDFSRTAESKDTWDFGQGWAGSYDAYTGGWADGAQRADELAATLRTRPTHSRPRVVRSVAGGAPNVGAYLAGSPVSMYRTVRAPAKARPFVHLFVPVSAAWMVNAENMFHRGVAVVALTQALERAGCRVAITCTDDCTSTLSGKGPSVSHQFDVKQYGARLDIDQCMFTMAHPAFLRRIVFAIMERSPHKFVRTMTNDNYGHLGPGADLQPDTCESSPTAVRVILPRVANDTTVQTPEWHLERLLADLPDVLHTDVLAAM